MMRCFDVDKPSGRLEEGDQDEGKRSRGELEHFAGSCRGGQSVDRSAGGSWSRKYDMKSKKSGACHIQKSLRQDEDGAIRCIPAGAMFQS
jgi:hypothetical protein